jgi:hypothetical protein
VGRIIGPGKMVFSVRDRNITWRERNIKNKNRNQKKTGRERWVSETAEYNTERES